MPWHSVIHRGLHEAVFTSSHLSTRAETNSKLSADFQTFRIHSPHSTSLIERHYNQKIWSSTARRSTIQKSTDAKEPHANRPNAERPHANIMNDSEMTLTANELGLENTPGMSDDDLSDFSDTESEWPKGILEDIVTSANKDEEKEPNPPEQDFMAQILAAEPPPLPPSPSPQPLNSSGCTIESIAAAHDNGDVSDIMLMQSYLDVLGSDSIEWL